MGIDSRPSRVFCLLQLPIIFKFSTKRTKNKISIVVDLFLDGVRVSTRVRPKGSACKNHKSVTRSIVKEVCMVNNLASRLDSLMGPFSVNADLYLPLYIGHRFSQSLKLKKSQGAHISKYGARVFITKLIIITLSVE